MGPGCPAPGVGAFTRAHASLNMTDGHGRQPYVDERWMRHVPRGKGLHPRSMRRQRRGRTWQTAPQTSCPTLPLLFQDPLSAIVGMRATALLNQSQGHGLPSCPGALWAL